MKIKLLRTHGNRGEAKYIPLANIDYFLVVNEGENDSLYAYLHGSEEKRHHLKTAHGRIDDNSLKTLLGEVTVTARL